MSIKISQLPILYTADNTTIMPVVNTGVTQQLSFPALATYIGTQLYATNTVSFTTTPVFNFALGSIQKMTLTASVISSSVNNPIDSVEYTFIISQNSTGGNAFVWPSAFAGAGPIATTGTTSIPNIRNVQKFVYSATTNTFYATTALISY